MSSSRRVISAEYLNLNALRAYPLEDTATETTEQQVEAPAKPAESEPAAKETPEAEKEEA